MNLSETEIIEAAWRILDALPSCSARSAADHIVEFLQELDDDGVIDRLNGGRSGQDLIAGLKASFSTRHAR